MDRTVLLSILVIAVFLISVPVAASAHLGHGYYPSDADVDQLDKLEPAALVERVAYLPKVFNSQSREDQSRDREQKSANGPAAGIPGSGSSSGSTVIPFEQVPPSETDREDSGIEIFTLAGSNQVRVEVFLGEQSTNGHDIEIVNVTRDDSSVTVHMLVQHPGPETTVEHGPTFPADAAEFTLPDGEYTITASLMAFDHSRETFSITV